MEIPDDDVGHDRLQALGIGHALSDVQGDIPEAVLESLGEGSPVRKAGIGVRGDRDIEPLRSQQRPRQSRDSSGQRPGLTCTVVLRCIARLPPG